MDRKRERGASTESTRETSGNTIREHARRCFAANGREVDARTVHRTAARAWQATSPVRCAIRLRAIPRSHAATPPIAA